MANRRWSGILVLALVTSGATVHAAGQRTAEKTSMARALDMIDRASKGGLLPAASAANKTRKPRADRLTPPQLLERAAQEAPVRPWLAKRYLARAQAESKRTKVVLHAGELQRIHDAVVGFEAAAAPRLAIDERSVVDQTPAVQGEDAARVRRYARLYAKMQREYNGARPDQRLAADKYFKGKITGDVPFWDVDASQAELLGLADRTPFRTPAGKVRVFSHYESKKEHAALEAQFGRGPDGHIPSEMTSSYRTLLMFPEDGSVPYMLKFSGHEVAGGETKRLSRADVAISIERSLQMRKVGRLVPEPAGIHVPGVDANVLYRPLRMPKGGLRRGDRLITWQVMMSPQFRATPAGQRIFRDHASYEDWFKAEAAPRLVDVVEESLLGSFAHYELHSQNIDVVVGADGKVRDVFIKDLLDMLHDPAMEAVSTRTPPKATGVLRDREWGNLNEADGKYGAKSFYDSYADQTGTKGGASIWKADDASRKELGRQLRARIQARLGKREAARVEARVGNLAPDAFMGDVLERYRYAILATRVESGFRPSKIARTRFQNGRGKVSAARFGEAGKLASAQGVEYGSVHGTPVAITRDAEGGVKDFWFKFE